MTKMSSALDIQISNPPNLEKIENFLKDSTYRETIEFSANFNTRLCIERRLRLPFLDPQTGVAQNHSNLFMDKRQRMPGFRQGQIYTYPAARWRKSRRQYLSKMYRFPDRPFQALRKEDSGIPVATGAGAGAAAAAAAAVAAAASASVAVPLPATIPAEPEFNGVLLEESSSLGGAGDTSDSKDSQQHLKEELPKEWFYDDMDINEIDSLEEPKSPADDEYDYDPRYGNKKRRKRRPGKKSLGTPTETSRKSRSSGGGAGASGSGRGGGRGRRKVPKDATSRLLDPPSPGIGTEPPSFETAAAAVGDIAADDHGDLRNYRKYL